MEEGDSYSVVHETLSWGELLRVDGELDIAVAEQFSAAIQKQLLGARPVVVDLSGCTYLDSTILNVLVRASNAAPDRLGVIVPEASRVRKLFKITNLEVPLRLSNSRDDVRSHFDSAAAP